jgi:hypothetical protein
VQRGKNGAFLDYPHSAWNQWYPLTLRKSRFFNIASPQLSTDTPDHTNS